MFIKKIKLNNIRSYTDGEIEFSEGSTLLSGDIGSGKSTILLAIEFSLFGIQRGDVSASELLRHGKNNGFVEMEFKINEKDYILKRNLKRGRAISQDICEFTENGNKKEYMPNEMRFKMLEILGYPQEVLKKNVPIYRFTVYTPQEQMKRIMFNEDERLNALRKIFNMDKYGRIKENVKLFSTELRTMKRELDAFSKDLNEVVKEREESIEQKVKISEELKSAENLLSSVDLKIQEKSKEIENTKEKLQETNKLKQHLLEKESSLNNEKFKIERTLKEIETADQRIFTSNEELQKYNDMQKPDYTTEEIENLISTLDIEKNSILSEKLSTEGEINRLKEVLENGLCSICGQNVSDPASFKENIDSKLSHIENVHRQIEEKEEKMNKFKQDKDDILKYEFEIQNMEKLNNDLMNMQKEKENLGSDLSDLNESVQLMETEIESLKPQVETTQVAEKEYELLAEDMKKFTNDKIEYERDKSRLDQEIHDTENKITSLDKTILEKKNSRQKIDRLNDVSNWMDNHFVNLMNQIEKNVMLTIQKEFDMLFQEWFNIIMQEDNIQVRIDENFTPIIMQNGFETNYDNLSGGEKTSVALAYRLALNKVINSLIDSIKTKDILILDEPTDGLSTEQLDRIRDVLNELQLRQIIIVSHEPKIDTYVNNVIRIYKENHISRINKE